MKKLPIGIQTFSDLRNNDYLYIDKTKDIHQMITSGKPFFLSRPRRFGKSLLVSTLEEIFKGNKVLFEGLYIYDKYDWTKQYPVIRIDFGNKAYSSGEELKSSLMNLVETKAEYHNLSLREAPLPYKFAELIEKLHLSTGSQAVVLIDEYDKPIIDNLSKPEVMEENKQILHNFYQVLKASDEHLRFIFLTGVSKFAGVSIFSGLNNLRDITLAEEYATICGYTQQELEDYFPEYINHFAEKFNINQDNLLNLIRNWYNGYSWDGRTSVYNPFSTLLLFAEKEFNNYWFRTGTPTFLIEILKRKNQLKPVLEPVTVSSRIFESFDPLRILSIPLLFQTDYLTIKHKEQGFPPQYTLDIPNREVRESLFEYLLNAYSDYPLESTQGLKQRMQQQLLAGDTSGLEQSLREMLAYVPYPLHI